METDVNRIKYLIEKLRSITLTVQLIPFIYTSFYVFVICLYPVCSDAVLNVLDTLFYVSPTIVLMMLVESRILRLCRWHKTACSLPLVPQVFVFIDYHVMPMNSDQVKLHYATLAAMCILLLLAAYNVFIKPKHNGRKERITRNPRLL